MLVKKTNCTIEEVHKIYIFTPHSTTGFAPFLFKFGREMRTKVPKLDYSAENPEVARDRDMEYKVMKFKDKNEVESRIRQGDTVVLKNERTGKLEPNSNPEKYTVVNLHCSDMVFTAIRTGNIVRHLVQFVRKVSHSPFQTEEEMISTS